MNQTESEQNLLKRIGPYKALNVLNAVVDNKIPNPRITK